MMIRKHISKTLVALAAVCCAMVAMPSVASTGCSSGSPGGGFMRCRMF